MDPEDRDAPDGGEEDRDLSLSEAVALAVGLHRQGRLDEAEAVYRAVLEARPDHPDALHFLGVLRHRLGHPEDAERLIRLALEAAPDHSGALVNLGNVLKDVGRLAEAEAAYRSALSLRPEDPAVLNNLGVALKGQGRFDEAIAALEQAAALAPDVAEVHYNLGHALGRAGRVREAVEAQCRAISLDPPQARSRKVLAYALHLLGRGDEAREVLDAWLAEEPDDAIALHLRAACDGSHIPDRAPDRYVRQTFDDFAASFDERLRGLDYRAPALLADAVAAALGGPRGELDVLDAGCGTGLCGPFLRPYARRLLGVDLSPAMLERARERGGYDALIEAELTAFLAKTPGAYDLVASADTLVYFGALDEVVGAAATALRPGGLLAFTLERTGSTEAPGGFVLQHHGRYRHAEAYVRDCLRGAGLAVEVIEGAALRTEAGEPVAGLVVAARRPGAHALRRPEASAGASTPGAADPPPRSGRSAGEPCRRCRAPAPREPKALRNR